MRVWELEEGKIYKRNQDIYKLGENRQLLYFDKAYNNWKGICRTYNEVVCLNFKEIKRELDWDKVPCRTKVQVRDEDSEEWRNAYFLDLRFDNKITLYVITFCDEFTYTNATRAYYKQIRLHPSVKPEENWYSEVQEVANDEKEE